MLSKSAIYELMDELLQSMTTYLVSESLTVPERAYVHAGEVAYDEEQLIIAAKRIYFGTVTSETLRDQKLPSFPRTVVLEVLYLECTPTQDGENPPAPSDLQASAESVLDWAVAIGNALINAHKNGVFSTCAGVAIGPSVPVGPQGGYVGFSQEIRVGVGM